jgi:hypothetical protein
MHLNNEKLMETNHIIAITVLLLASAGVTFAYLLKNSAIYPKQKSSMQEDEEFMYNFLVIMGIASVIGLVCATIILNGYFTYVF